MGRSYDNFRELRRRIRRRLRSHRFNREVKRGNVTYSQDGEDIILQSILFRLNGDKIKKNGFYIDVGAHHPFRFSNTAILHKHGWTGINIDPSPESIELFDRYRPNDVNLNVGIGNTTGELNYYSFAEGALNTFVDELAQEHVKNGIKLEKVKKVALLSLGEIADKYVPDNSAIDFLNVDVEGLDYEVLESNDWSKCNPTIIAVEQIGVTISELPSSKIAKYLSERSYVAIVKTYNTAVYLQCDALERLPL